MSKDIISQLFNIKDSKTCIFGATLMDTDLRSGYSKNDMRKPKTNSSTNPYLGLYLYPAIKEVQNQVDPDSFPLSLMSTWINGFIPNNTGMKSAANVCDKTNEILNNTSIIKTEQVLNNRTDEQLQALFSFFKFYGYSDPIPVEATEEKIKEYLIECGLVCRNWLNNPLSIKYVVRREGNGQIPDYIYLIGGSEDLLVDNPKDIINDIKNMYLKGIHDRTFEQDIKGNLWLELSPDFLNSLSKNDQELLVCKTKYMRLMTGVIFIRNYFYYAYHEMGIQSVVEFNNGKIRKIHTKKLLDSYEEVYQYCKTIVNISSMKKDLSAENKNTI